MRGVAAAGGCSFRSRARCSIRSTGTRSGLVSPLRTVLLPAGLGLAACPSHGASLRCRAAYRQRRAEDPYRPAKLMADAIRRIIQPGNIVGGHHYSISASVSPSKSMTPVSTPKSGRSVIPSPGMHQRVPAETACEILHKALPRKRYGPGPVGHACRGLLDGTPLTRGPAAVRARSEQASGRCRAAGGCGRSRCGRAWTCYLTHEPVGKVVWCELDAGSRRGTVLASHALR